MKPPAVPMPLAMETPQAAEMPISAKFFPATSELTRSLPQLFDLMVAMMAKFL